MAIRLVVLLVMMIIGLGRPAGAGEREPVPPRVFALDPQTLAKTASRVRAGDDALRPAVDRLRREATQALGAGPYCVTQKTRTPPSGDKHDYFSFGPYWWPDPAKPDGLPYVRRDGEVNPESRSDASDSPALRRMAESVDTLALAYYLTGDEAYAEKAVQLLRAWFLDPVTKMNPNLQYGQAIPGRVEGRGTGIIDTVRLIRVVDAIGLLESSRAWGPKDQEGMVVWFAAYLDWLRTSEHGRAERAATNNHGTWYDAQVASFGLFVGRESVVREAIQCGRQQRLARQIEPDGRQPAELARTRPFSYSIFNLQALFTLAALGNRVGVDLWHEETPDGRSLRKALDFLAAYADPQEAWPYRDLTFDRSQLIPLLEQGAAVYGETYRKALAQLPAKDIAESRGRLIYLP